MCNIKNIVKTTLQIVFSSVFHIMKQIQQLHWKPSFSCITDRNVVFTIALDWRY